MSGIVEIHALIYTDAVDQLRALAAPAPAAALQSSCEQWVLKRGSCPWVTLAGFTSASLPCRLLAAAGVAS